MASATTNESSKFSFQSGSLLSKMSEISIKDRIMIHVIDDNKSQKKDF